MATKTQIVNFALRRLGCEPVGSILDDNKRAKCMSDVYDISRQEALELFPWSFAKARAALTANAVVPAFGYSYSFDLPTDFITVVSEHNETEYHREGGYLLADSDTLNIVYIKDATDESIFTSAFNKAFALVLAKEGSFALTQDSALLSKLEAELFRLIEDAKFADSKGSTQEDYEINDFLDVRL